MALEEQQRDRTTAPRTNVVSRVSHTKPVIVLEDIAANDSDLTEADLEAIDREFAIAAKKEFVSAIASAAVNDGGVHFLAPEGNGHGPSSSARMRCTCGWIGPDRFEWQDDMCRLLEDDKTRHLRGAA